MSNGSNRMTDILDNSLMLSPMGNLAVNFSGTSLSSTPCFKLTARRLSMSSLTPGTPSDNSSLFDCSDSKGGTPRLSKHGLRLVGRGSLFRRMNSAPVTLSGAGGGDPTACQDGGNKENAGQGATPGPMSPLRGGKAIEKRDSGYAAEDTPFRFAEPSGYPPKRGTSVVDSPKILEGHTTMSKSPSQNVRRNDGKFAALSFGSAGSLDDGFMELADLDKSFTDENEELPPGLGNLLKGPLLDSKLCGDDDKSTANVPRPPLRRFNSLVDSYSSPASSRARVGLFRDDLLSPDESSPSDKLPFKRPREVDCNNSKRRKSNSLQTITEKATKDSHSRYKLQRSISETAATSLAMVLHKSDLIADFSRPYALPMISGRHEDLKSITCDTLAALLNGKYSNKVDSFKIIDCRYPYEYEGGHIKGSLNLYTKEQVEQELFSQRSLTSSESSSESEQSEQREQREESEQNEESEQENGEKKEERNILVFHCEFSLERGPALYRFLRRCDRNLSSYPSLHYPEVYLLHGGYSSFFSSHKSLCEPCSYQPMVDPKHESDLRRFRVKSNSWSGDLKRQAARSGLKRLGLF